MSLNKVHLIGHLGRDPEVRILGTGGEVANLRVATSETWKDRATGERKERTEWHSVIVFAEGAVKFAKAYLKKGAKVYVEGRLQTRKWQDQQGADRYSTEIVIQPFGGELQSLDRREADPGRNDYSGHTQDGRWNSGSPAAGAGRPPPELDDDIPF